MGQKNKKPIHKDNSSASKKRSDGRPTYTKQSYLVFLIAIIIISFVTYLPALQNHFVWDDEAYIQKNVLIHSINLKNLFSNYVLGNYHPLTMLVYALEYHSFGLNEKGYHMVNLLLHLANVALVFYVILALSDKVSIALIASLLFGIHPMHVESVAWASQLKDLLYAFFFLSSYLCYLKYMKYHERKYYLYCIFLFLLSLLSKAMAASLPVLLLITDYLMPHLRNSSGKGKVKNSQIWLDKIPFFILAIIFGVVAIYAQKSTEALEVIAFPFPERIAFSCYGFITYLVKLVLPLNLSPLYPYPVKVGTPIPSQYYIYVFALIAFAAGVFYSVRFTKKIIFGIGFFAVTVFLVLQLLPVGNAVMADRYSYLPSIGIFYLFAEGLYWLWNRKWSMMSLKYSAVVLLILFTVFFSAKTYSMCSVWKDGVTLWTYTLTQSPDLAIAYYNRAVMFRDEAKDEDALKDFDNAIRLEPKYINAYNNRGVILGKKNQFDAAIKDFNKAMLLNPDNAEAYSNLGIIQGKMKNYADAISDFSKAIELQPGNPELYANRALSLQNSKRFDEAIKDYDKAIELNPNSPMALYNRAVIEYNSGKKETACMDFRQAFNLGFPPAEESYNKLCR